ncbi:flagellar biosynthetic protein FliR [Undibacterium sp. Ji49W]|uniref:flagellar biosynthetic protein FliR n=1 Tax=Undibacterium sp. Ji49W TaxID=3413040 RepID=UPI003BF2A973
MAMYSNYIFDWIASINALNIFFLSIRLAAVFVLSPILYSHTLPSIFRVTLILTISVVMSLGIDQGKEVSQPAMGEGFDFIVLAAVREMALGATFALGIFISFATISIAGQILDIQIGFGMARIFDPLTRTQLPILTSAFNQLAVIYFFLLNGHHVLLRALALSLDYFPLGHAWSIEKLAVPVLKQVSGLFSLGFALAAPVVFTVLLIELVLGVVARNLPQMNMFVMGVPVKIITGLSALSFGLLAMSGLIIHIQELIFKTWGDMFSSVEVTSALLTGFRAG